MEKLTLCNTYLKPLIYSVIYKVNLYIQENTNIQEELSIEILITLDIIHWVICAYDKVFEQLKNLSLDNRGAVKLKVTVIL